jgi:hypothetical protein
MWNVSPTEQWQKDRKFYDKKHPRELSAVLNNLIRYQSLLNCSPNARSAIAGYLHPEPGGVVAIDQKGGGPGLQETRMYTYPHEAEKLLYLITIGNKSSQHDDIQFSKKFVQDHFPVPPRAE